MKIYLIVYTFLLFPSFVGANIDDLTKDRDICSLYQEKVERYSQSGNYDSPWFKTDFWDAIDTLEAYDCEAYLLALNVAGYLHYSDNNILSAKEALFKSENLIDHTKPSDVLLRNQLFIGLVYVQENDLNNAILYFKRSLSVSEELKQFNSVADAKLNLGLAFIEKKDYVSAEQYLTEARSYFEENPEYPLSLGYTYLNLARIHDDRNNTEQTLFFFDQVETVWKKENHRKGLLMLNVSKYHFYNKRDQTEKGIPFLLKAMDESIETDTKIFLSQIYNHLGKAYSNIGDTDSSFDYYKKALKLGYQLAPDELNELIDIMGEMYFNQDGNSEYQYFLDNIKNILLYSHKERMLESSKLFSNESLIDTLSNRTNNLENINTKNKRKIQNQLKTFGLIMLFSLLIMWIIFQVSQERKKLNLEIRNQYNKLKTVNSKLVEYSSRIKDQNRLYEIKNQELKNFAYVASHDLKSPLKTITSFLGLLKAKNATSYDDKQLEYFRIIEQSGQTLTHLIDDLLEHAELESSKLNYEHFDCSELLSRVLLNLSEEIDSNMANVNIDDSVSVKIVADEIKLYQVFQNLISNAIKYCSSDIKPRIHIASTQDDKYFHFHIKDNGIGVKPENQYKIFEMFEKGNSVSQKDSYGIGLATSRKIIDMHGGKIGVEANPMGGSIFSFSIPKNIQPS